MLRTELLRAKLAPVRPRTPLVVRAGLLARLRAAESRRLTLLVAPAGYGKTTLASAWLAARGPAAPPAAWLTLDPGDSDPASFWRYLAAACGALGPGVGDGALAILEGPRPRRTEAAAAALLNDLAAIEGGALIVLEDYHAVASRAVHDGVSAFVDRLPPGARALVISRSEPPLALARLRARGELLELRAPDLRFDEAEVAQLLEISLPGGAAPGLAARLVERTEGWPAGLRLAVLALQAGGPGAARLPEGFGGGHEHVSAFLAAEVLDAQPAPVLAFLLETSLLGRLSGPLCDAATGRGGGGEALAAVERAGLFLTPLDGARQWYRYHALFAEALRAEALRRLGPARAQEIRRRARGWCESAGLLEDAVELALDAGDHAEAAALLEALVGEQAHWGEARSVRRWAERLPEAALSERPAVAMALAAAVLFSEDRGAPATRRLVEAPLELAERSWRAAGDGGRLGGALAFRSLAAIWQGDLREAFGAARHALALLPDSERWWRGVCLIALAMEADDAGRLAQARALLLEGRARCEEAGNQYAARAATYGLAEVTAQLGELDQAEALYRQMLAGAGDDPTDEAHALGGLAWLALLRDELGQAEELAARALAAAGRSGDGPMAVEAELLIPLGVLRARLLRARGRPREARQMLGGLAAQALRHSGGRLARMVAAEDARAALELGDRAALRRWATATAAGGEVSRSQREREALITARMLIAGGDHEEALRALGRWREEARADDRALAEVEALAVSALGRAAAGDLGAAAEELGEALRRAWGCGARRLLLGEGPALAQLARRLAPALARAGLQRELDELLAAAEGEPEAAPAARGGRGEPLSPQELRVARLVRAGLSNPEIADELVVSVNTVKTHVQSIYRKLAVGSRRELRALARQPGAQDGGPDERQ